MNGFISKLWEKRESYNHWVSVGFPPHIGVLETAFIKHICGLFIKSAQLITHIHVSKIEIYKTNVACNFKLLNCVLVKKAYSNLVYYFALPFFSLELGWHCYSDQWQKGKGKSVPYFFYKGYLVNACYKFSSMQKYGYYPQ